MAQQTFSIDSWGGANYRDQADQLIARSHAQYEGGWRQYPGVGTESPNLLNMDYDPEGMKKRLGSASYQDLSATIPSGDSVVSGGQWTNGTGSTFEYVVTTTTILTNATGSWGQINATTGASVFAFASNVTKCTEVDLDGHLFWLTDGTSNYIQTARSGTQIDPQMTTGNGYTDAFGSATSHAITGTWPQGSHIGAKVHSRLAWAEDGILIQYTPMAHESSSGIWDLTGAGAGAFHASNEIRFMTSMIPKGANEATDEMLIAGTAGGIESTTGFQDYDRLNVERGAEGGLNHKAFCVSNNWLLYLTINRNLHAYNGDSVIDLGARLRSAASTGPLDDMEIATAKTHAFGLYHPEKMQAMFWFPTSTSRVNDAVAVVDFKEGEPVPREPQTNFERRVRAVPWQIISPDDNDWFIYGYNKVGASIGIKANGTLWTMESGLNDLGTLAVNGFWRSGIITGGAPFVNLQKQWVRLSLRAEQSGDWEATITEYHDREDAAFKSWDMTLVNPGAPIVGTATVPFTLVSGGDVREFDRIGKRSEAFQFQIENSRDSQDFLMKQASVTYEIGAEVS